MSNTSIVIPNFNGKARLKACLDSLIRQSLAAEIIVVDNGSTDGSSDFVREKYPSVVLLQNEKNLGFAGGVNTGIRYSLAKNYDSIALLNNDAVAEANWLEKLVNFLVSHPKAGIVTSKILAGDGKHLDSTGDIYTVWGLPFPRGRDELDKGQYDSERWVFGASGGASLYRAKMLEQIGLFDEDFFAYYEDVDISFRAQLAGWKIGFEPKAQVIHQIAGTSSRMKGLSTTKTLQNLPWLLWKNVPTRLLLIIWPRFVVAYTLMAMRALMRGEFLPFIKGVSLTLVLRPKKLIERRKIQESRKVSISYIDSIIIRDLPPNAHRLRALRTYWWRLRGKSA